MHCSKEIKLKLKLQHQTIFEANELQTLHESLALMQSDIRQRYVEVLDQSHHGTPSIIQTTHTGRPGRPRILIDPEFLSWAHGQTTTSRITRFLNVGRSTVRNTLLEHGITSPQANPFPTSSEDTPRDNGFGNTTEDDDILNPIEDDDILNPTLPIPSDSAANIENITGSGSVDPSTTSHLSTLTDSALDDTIIRLRSHYRRAGITMLHGMLRRIGLRVPHERIRQSLLRVDPVRRVFERIRIRRCEYRVAGPNALWHHDGQHGALFSQNLYL